MQKNYAAIPHEFWNDDDTPECCRRDLANLSIRHRLHHRHRHHYSHLVCTKKCNKLLRAKSNRVTIINHNNEIIIKMIIAFNCNTYIILSFKNKLELFLCAWGLINVSDDTQNLYTIYFYYPNSRRSSWLEETKFLTICDCAISPPTVDFDTEDLLACFDIGRLTPPRLSPRPLLVDDGLRNDRELNKKHIHTQSSINFNLC